MRKTALVSVLVFFSNNWIFDHSLEENLLHLLVSENFFCINRSGYSNEQIDEFY
jgi:hypothetical protein